MAKLAVMAGALLSLSFVGPAKAGGFLQLQREDVKQLLLAELSGHASASQVASIEKDMRAMYTALPKGEGGQLEPATVRYALHRYFVMKHGWYVVGLDSDGEAWQASPNATIMKDRAPAYIQGLFAEQLHGQGLGLHELAVFAATLEDLVHAEVTGSLEWIYSILGLPLVGAVGPSEADRALHYMLVAYFNLDQEFVARNVNDFRALEAQVRDEFRYFPVTEMWLADLRHSFDLEQASRRNPFVERTRGFDESVAFTLEFGRRFGSYQNLECFALKSKLADMEHRGTGRVLLSTFYSRSLAGDWQFSESEDFLRNQGALDETDPLRPSVLIPNYLNSKTNCLTGSGFYSVCCMDECEGLLGHVEQKIAAPSSSPTRIAEVVSSLHSDTVDAPRNLSASLLSRLDEIAQFHGGLVPLHGRLFAQWMHHAYPRECSYPHLAGTTKPLTQEEWIEQMGFDGLSATQDVMEKHASQAGPSQDELPGPLPWILEEELVAESAESKMSWGSSSLRYLAFAAALGSFAVPLARTWQVTATSPTPSKVERHLV